MRHLNEDVLCLDIVVLSFGHTDAQESEERRCGVDAANADAQVACSTSGVWVAVSQCRAKEAAGVASSLAAHPSIFVDAM